jgi:hypothetical protein
MDDLTLIRSFRAERDDGDPRARAAAWGELEAMFEPASAPPASPTRSPRRGLLALAGAGALAAVAAAILALSSGGSPEPAAAEALHETAAVAASGDGAPALQAGPGQFYFTKMKTVEFEGWIPGGETADGPITSQPGGFSALVPKDVEYWTSPEGGGRVREAMGTPQFLSNAEQSRWEQAGSPLPLGFDPRYDQPLLHEAQRESNRKYLETSRGVLDIEDPRSGGGNIHPKLSNVPTDPKELRLAIQSGRAPGISEPDEKPLGPDETAQVLEGILTPTYPNASPALRAAAFNALAEMPGFALDRNATDLLGRTGYAISRDRGHGMREEFIFDPATSKPLGERIVLAEPWQEPYWQGYEAGLALRDVAYLQSKVVDSTREPAEEGQDGGPIATTGPVYHR